ncbi:hypothetical protein DY000_02008539 [Brassica cretica]|uniref:Pentatricopeptide repeat-containing protein n=1 Tax=Brassica cretica TaxID=69181 RepID=A0ABQ7BZV6_BRACR|nr:hypothetical protein DY000_02008539 [Brassica cretica]
MGLPVNNNNQGNNTIPFFSPVSETQQQQPHMSYCSDQVNNHDYNPIPDSCKEVLNNHNTSLAWGQNQFPYNHHNYGFINQNEHCSETKNNNSVMAIQSQLVNLQMASNQQEEEVDDQNYDEIHQFLEIIDESQSFTETKEVYASSSGESLKEPIDEIGEKELRRAATCFSLTSKRNLHSWVISSCSNEVCPSRPICPTSRSSVLAIGAQVHAYITKIGLCTEPSVGSSLLTMYSKFGSIEDCCKAFNQINGPNLIAWTALIASFAQHGKGTEALKMFNLMKQKGIKPDKVTFVGVLSLVVMVVWPKKLICI